MTHPPEKPWHLWLLAVSPAIWAAHFLCSYVTAAVWCAKVAAGERATLEPVRWAIAAYTLAALVGIAINGYGGHRRQRLASESREHDSDTPTDRHRFLGFATVLLSVLSAVAVGYAAIVIVFFEDCR